eukprot:949547_1
MTLKSTMSYQLLMEFFSQCCKGENGQNGTTNTDSINARNIEKGSPAAMLLMQQQQQTEIIKDSLNEQEQEHAKKSLDVAIMDEQKAMVNAMIDEKDKGQMESNVLLLMNMLNEEDIDNDEEYEDIK